MGNSPPRAAPRGRRPRRAFESQRERAFGLLFTQVSEFRDDWIDADAEPAPQAPANFPLRRTAPPLVEAAELRENPLHLRPDSVQILDGHLQFVVDCASPCYVCVVWGHTDGRVVSNIRPCEDIIEASAGMEQVQCFPVPAWSIKHPLSVRISLVERTELTSSCLVVKTKSGSSAPGDQEESEDHGKSSPKRTGVGFANLFFRRRESFVSQIEARCNAMNARGNRLFVTQLAEELTKADLEAYFSQFGELTDIFVPLRNPNAEPQDGMHKGIAFVSFKNHKTYEEVSRKDKHEIKPDVFIVVDKVFPPSHAPPPPPMIHGTSRMGKVSLVDEAARRQAADDKAAGDQAGGAVVVQGAGAEDTTSRRTAGGTSVLRSGTQWRELPNDGPRGRSQSEWTAWEKAMWELAADVGRVRSRALSHIMPWAFRRYLEAGADLTKEGFVVECTHAEFPSTASPAQLSRRPVAAMKQFLWLPTPIFHKAVTAVAPNQQIDPSGVRDWFAILETEALYGAPCEGSSAAPSKAVRPRQDGSDDCISSAKSDMDEATPTSSSGVVVRDKEESAAPARTSTTTSDEDVFFPKSSSASGRSNAADAGASWDRDCLICLEDVKSVIILPCRHMCLCAACAERMRARRQLKTVKCPICRERVSSFISCERSDLSSSTEDSVVVGGVDQGQESAGAGAAPEDRRDAEGPSTRPERTISTTWWGQGQRWIFGS